MPDLRPLLQATGQYARLKRIGIVTALGAASLLGASKLQPKCGSEVTFIVLFGGIALFAGGLIYGLRVIKCPRCKVGWLHHAIGKMPFGSNFVGWLIWFETCPKCGLTSADLDGSGAVQQSDGADRDG